MCLPIERLASETLSYACRYASSYLSEAPEALDEHVVAPGTFAVHADRDSMIVEQPGKEPIGELRW